MTSKTKFDALEKNAFVKIYAIRSLFFINLRGITGPTKLGVLALQYLVYSFRPTPTFENTDN
jgi:hypothetical protein